MNNWFQLNDGSWVNLDHAKELFPEPPMIAWSHGGRTPITIDDFNQIVVVIETGQTRKKKKKKNKAGPLNPPGEGI